MHKLMMVTAIVLAATAAHAEGTRGLITLASSDRGDPKPVEPAKPVEQANKPVEQTAQPAAVQPAETRPADAYEQRMDQKSRRKVRHESDRHWAERRIRGELARCGIY
jgi:hypothetical protein